jgi:hypothetical protein
VAEFGEESARDMRGLVEVNMENYDYMRGFKI